MVRAAGGDYALVCTMICPVQETTTSQFTATSTSSSSSYQQIDETYKAVLGAVKNYLLPFFKNSERYFIQRMIEKLDFKIVDNCWLMINLLKEAEKMNDSDFYKYNLRYVVAAKR